MKLTYTKIKYFVSGIRILITNIFYHLRCRFIDKYYLVDSKLDKYVYHDRCDVLFHACFSILQDFVDIELMHMYDICYDKTSNFLNNTEKLKSYAEKMNSDHYDTIYVLYKWWVNIRPTRIDPYYLISCSPDERVDFIEYDGIRYTSYDTLESKYETEDQFMLQLLISVRRNLWT